MGDRTLHTSYYLPPADGLSDSEFKDFCEDLNHLLSRPGAWSVAFLVSSGALEPKLPTHLHFNIGGEKGEEFDMEDSLVKDKETYKKIYNLIEERVGEQLGLECDHQKYHSSNNPRVFYRSIGVPNENNIVLRIEWDKILWDPNRLLLARLIAEVLSEVILNKPLPDVPELKRKDIGFETYLKE
ncbi:MAG: hypothetical protein K2J23_03195 [Muribaculaceae bacterium]|nr:hypothetical protein [Muribaculaceae bacterium]